MKDCLSTEYRKLLSKKFEMNENCHVTEYVKAIDNSLSNKRNEYNGFLEKFENDLVDHNDILKILAEIKTLKNLKLICMEAYQK